MRVVFDSEIFMLQKYGGISRYFFELAKHLNDIESCTPNIVVPDLENEYLAQEKGSKFIKTFGPGFKKLLFNRFYDHRAGVNEKVTKQYCRKKNAILHQTYYFNDLKVSCPKIITIHDMIPELFHSEIPAQQHLISKKKAAIAKADGIIAVSESTKNDLIKCYPDALNKTVVVHHGVDVSGSIGVKPFVNQKPFLLFVGHRDDYKNFLALLNVYGANIEINRNFDLLCFGGYDFSVKESQMIDQLGLNSKVRRLKGSDKELFSLYRSAAVLVYTSKYEGFGMPVLEAMSLGCPVICSNTSSLPEVAGNAAMMVGPGNEEELLHSLKLILIKGEERDAMIERGKKQASLFSWKKCAEETYRYYKGFIDS